MQYDENAEKYGYEGEMTPMKCDELKAYKGDVYIPVYGSIADADVYLKKDVDAAIAELKEAWRSEHEAIATLQETNEEKTERIMELQKQVDKLDVVKKSAEQILKNLLDCGLIKEWYFNGKFNAVLKADDPHLQIAKLKQKLEDVQASAYADSVDAGMRERRLKRALRLLKARYFFVLMVYASDLARVANPSIIHKSNFLSNPTPRCMEEYQHEAELYDNARIKCLAKAEEYK